MTVEGQQKIGNFTVSFVDLEIPLAGIPIQVVWTYDSREKRSLDFGYGWTLDVRQGSYRNNRKPSDGWRIVQGFVPCQVAQETKPHLTTIRLSDREIYRFRLSVTRPAITQGGCFAEAGFAFVDGPVPGAMPSILGGTELFYANGTSDVVDAGSLEPYDPRTVRLTTRDGVVQGYIYTLGAAGNRTKIEETDGNVRTYAYDPLYRLTGESVAKSGAQVYAKTFHYDPVDNRLQQFHTDAAGTATTTNGTFDTGDRVKSETQKPDGTTVAVDYLVDTSGALSQVVAETSGGALAAFYVRGDDLLSVVHPGAAVGTWASRFYHADGLGSIRALTDESGAVSDRYEFTAFGELLRHEGEDANAYLFAGEMLSPSVGSYYNRARWMNPRVGRFISPDLAEGRIYEPISLHKYAYANQDPINVTDPSGNESLLSVAVTQGLIGALASFTITALVTRNLKKSLYSALGGLVIGFFVGGTFHWLRGLVAARSAATVAATVGAADDIIISADKLRYLLQLDPGKAKGFAELGYTLENADDLASLLRYSRSLVTEGSDTVVTEFGAKYVVAMKVIGANGRQGLIEVVWQVDRGTTLYRLITAIAKPF